MPISLQPQNMLGHWTDSTPRTCEFQHGSTLILVEYVDAYPMERKLAAAQQTINDAFAEVPCALTFASAVSAARHPAFWKHANRIALRQSLLNVFSIRYVPDSDQPIYDISWNPGFQPESSLAYSENWVEEMVEVHTPDDHEFIHVKRICKNQYQLLD
ncbi:hypothetical protein ABB27_01760 [Stenotrophomonas terrae]|uniref:Uncharacterized protein n=1 Tax=Stenotrophomonas terrae TaxID=405446 RepID=A0A0R0CT39_9GAMM|nr:hypothetical protein [Stenotrophomonas terrae]KRG72406.1 hypothetical protein ABB27_01760 [Stenotrophomonas terrae]